MTDVDVDVIVRATHGHVKQGSGFDCTGVRGLIVLLWFWDYVDGGSIDAVRREAPTWTGVQAAARE